MRLWQTVVQLECPLCRSFGLRNLLLRGENTATNEVAVVDGQLCISKSVSLINCDRLLKILNGFLLAIQISFVAVEASFQPQLIGCEVSRFWFGNSLLLTTAQTWSQLLGDLTGNLRLNRD